MSSTPFAWPRTWRIINDRGEQQRLINELQRELGAEHILYECKAVPIAMDNASDDVMFKLNDGPPHANYALVHLTWRGMENDPHWPATTLFETLDVWANTWSDSYRQNAGVQRRGVSYASSSSPRSGLSLRTWILLGILAITIVAAILVSRLLNSL